MTCAGKDMEQKKITIQNIQDLIIDAKTDLTQKGFYAKTYHFKMDFMQKQIDAKRILRKNRSFQNCVSKVKGEHLNRVRSHCAPCVY